jgi:membrane protein
MISALPDMRLDWRTALGGGLAIVILLAVDAAVIGRYLARGSVAGGYVAAGAFVVLLVWVYYCGANFFLNTDLVRAWRVECGTDQSGPLGSTSTSQA